MASLWDLLMGSGSITGGAPQQQPTGLFSSLAGSSAAPMGSGFVPGQATPQAPQLSPAPAPVPAAPTSMGLPAFASGQLPALNIGQQPKGFAAIRPAAAAPAAGDDDDDAPKGVIAAGLAQGAKVAASAGAPTDIRPQAQGGSGLPAASSADTGPLGSMSSLLGRVKNIYGNGGPFDPLINLGIGMNSGPGGLQRALEQTSNQAQQGQNNALQQLNMQIAQTKLARETQTKQQGSAAYIKAAYAAQGQPITDDQAAALAQNSGAVSTIVSNTFKDKAATPQLVDVPQPDGSTQKQWITPGAATGTAVGTAATRTPDAVRDLQFARQNWQQNGLPDPNNPANAGFWQDFAQKRLAGGGGVSVSLPPAEKASDAAYGQAEGKHFGDILSAGDAAHQTQNQLAFMNDAFQQGGSNITTGPFAKSILAGKQAIQGLTGIDLGGVPESEAVNKLGFGLATTLAKEISARPSQAEFLKGLQNVPGIFMSQPGSRVMMSILNQQAQQKVDLGQLVQDPANRRNWGSVEQHYLDTHPLMSPFTGKPLSVSDLTSLRSSAQQAGIDPATGQPSGGSPTPSTISAAPTWSFTPGG